MSLEHFSQTHPASPELREIMLRKKERGKNSGSLVSLLAFDMAQAAGSGIQELTREFSYARVAMNFDPDLFKRMDPKNRNALIQHHAAVVFGVSVLGIEDALWTRVFDRSVWFVRYNLAMAGTPFRGTNMRGKGIEELPAEQHATMIYHAGKDKTLSVFFNGELKSLPTGLRSILEQAGRLQQIRSGVLPIYSERARFLVGQ